MKVVALIDKPYSPYGWWRVVSPFNVLKQTGIDTSFGWDIDSVRDAVVILPRIIIKGGSENSTKQWIDKLRFNGAKKLIYDVDDDIVSGQFIKHMTDCGRASLVSLNELDYERQQHIKIMNLCDSITVTTEPLKQIVQRYVNVPVHVVPNAIDVEWYLEHTDKKARYQKHKKYIHIGWAGGLRPDSDFELLAQAWKFINKKYKHVKFVIAGYQPNPLYAAVDFDKIIRIPYQPINKWPTTTQVDIGCCVVADTGFNRCKSPIKAFEYIVGGALPIASNTVYFNSGLESLPIATSEHGWKYFLDYFISNWLDKELHVASLMEEVNTKHNLRNPEVYNKWITAYES